MWTEIIIMATQVDSDPWLRILRLLAFLRVIFHYKIKLSEGSKRQLKPIELGKKWPYFRAFQASFSQTPLEYDLQ